MTPFFLRETKFCFSSRLNLRKWHLCIIENRVIFPNKPFLSLEMTHSSHSLFKYKLLWPTKNKRCRPFHEKKTFLGNFFFVKKVGFLKNVQETFCHFYLSRTNTNCANFFFLAHELTILQS